MSHQSIWATGDDNTSWNYEPQLKKPRNVQASADTIVVGTGNTASSAGRSKAIGNMFFKTKLCCKFRAGVCPYVTDCNFAHGMEELCHPPTNWQDIVAAHDDEGGNLAVQRREEHAIPTFGSGEIRGESLRSHKGRHCKKFYTEEGCPYGDSCTFMHEEQSRSRESVAISLNPTICGSSTSAADATGSGNDVPGPNLKPSNWKTRICNKWETTGSCPFGIKCHFAHGLQELHKYGGGLLETKGRDLSTDQKQVGAVSKGPTNTIVAAVSIAAPPTDSCLTGLEASLQRWPSSVAIQALGQCHLQKWKGPNKISKIYGDWIDDIE